MTRTSCFASRRWLLLVDAIWNMLKWRKHGRAILGLINIVDSFICHCLIIMMKLITTPWTIIIWSGYMLLLPMSLVVITMGLEPRYLSKPHSALILDLHAATGPLIAIWYLQYFRSHAGSKETTGLSEDTIMSFKTFLSISVTVQLVLGVLPSVLCLVAECFRGWWWYNTLASYEPILMHGRRDSKDGEQASLLHSQADGALGADHMLSRALEQHSGTEPGDGDLVNSSSRQTPGTHNAPLIEFDDRAGFHTDREEGDVDEVPQETGRHSQVEDDDDTTMHFSARIGQGWTADIWTELFFIGPVVATIAFLAYVIVGLVILCMPMNGTAIWVQTFAAVLILNGLSVAFLSINVLIAIVIGMIKGGSGQYFGTVKRVMVVQTTWWCVAATCTHPLMMLVGALMPESKGHDYYSIAYVVHVASGGFGSVMYFCLFASLFLRDRLNPPWE